MRSEGRERAAAVGMFDGVHTGHQHMLRELRAGAEARGLLPAAFTFDIHPLQLVAPGRAPRLLTPLDDKVRLLRHYGAADVQVLAFTPSLRALTAREFFTLLRDSYGVRYVLAGYNHRCGSDGASGDDYAAIGRELGLTIERAGEYTAPGVAEKISSSAIRRSLCEGRVELAAAMLGRPYEIAGTVGHGRGIGHTIGFPTANLQPGCPQQQVPAGGVYAARARVGEQWLPAMVNIGTCPTVGGRDTRIEAHVIGIDANLYFQPLSLRFAARLRDERAFGNVDELCAQLRADRQAALRALETAY